MANLPRSPLIFRTWLRDPYRISVNSQTGVWTNNWLELSGKDKLFGAAGQVPDFDWPNPRGYVPSIVLKTWIDPLKVNLAGQDKLFGAAGQVPDFDWPNPRGPQRSIDLLTWVKGFQLQFTIPFHQIDWPNPRGPLQGSISLRTWIDPLKLNLRSQDSFFGAAGQPPANLDWPNPRGYVPSIALRTWLGRVAGASNPFFGLAGNPNFDWPNPRGPIPNIELRTWVDRTKLALQGQDTFFGLAGNPNFDWPNPRGYVPNIALRTWTGRVAGASNPFAGLAGRPNFDWPNPRGPLPTHLRTWQQGFQLQLQTIAAARPNNQFNWPNPRAPRASTELRTWLGQVNGQLLSPVAAPVVRRTQSHVIYY